VIALAWPGPTALVLVLIVGVWAITVGVIEIAAFGVGQPAATPGHVHPGRPGHGRLRRGAVRPPGIGTITLALLFGLFSLIVGTWVLMQGIELRRTGKTLNPSARRKAPA
jgi:uncharacterized membrane protein HdeD (DUF308 family)